MLGTQICIPPGSDPPSEVPCRIIGNSTANTLSGSISDCRIKVEYSFAVTDRYATFGVICDNIEVGGHVTLPLSKKMPIFFPMNLATGGGWPVDLSRYNGVADMYVDYVRVYQAKK